MNRHKITLILASASPRRRELMAQAGLPCRIISSSDPEMTLKTSPQDIVMDLAHKKAARVFSGLPDDRDEEYAVIGADTVVACDGMVLGKPADKKEELTMLHMLQGRSHDVYTGVSIISDTACSTFFCGTEVSISPMTEEEMERYADSDEPYDKAGGYAIQGRFAVFVNEIRGNYSNVVGLPIARLYQELSRMELLPQR
ncbi:MAG: Maf family protein [Bilifractor sp.]|jgi:septum formation protein|nr:Maf family protein [Lachnospiraceae bacterium]